MNHQRSRLQLAINAAVDSHYEDAGSLKSRAAKEILTSCLDKYERQEIESHQDLESSVEELKTHEAWQGVTSLLDGVEDAIVGHKGMGIGRGSWVLPSGRFIDKLKEPGHPFLMAEFSNLTEAYARRFPGSCPSLEKFLVSALIHTEAHAAFNNQNFEEAVRPSSSAAKGLGALSLLIAAIWSSVEIGHSFGTSLGVASFSAWCFCAALLSRLKDPRVLSQQTMLQSMRAAYLISSRGRVSPVELEDRLKISEMQGAVWPDGVRTLVAQARARDQARWQR